MAEQQGKYLARVLNAKARGGEPAAAHMNPFRYRHMGSMATIGMSLCLSTSSVHDANHELCLSVTALSQANHRRSFEVAATDCEAQPHQILCADPHCLLWSGFSWCRHLKHQSSLHFIACRERKQGWSQLLFHFLFCCSAELSCNSHPHGHLPKACS